MKQEEIFFKDEGDRWFQRNQEGLIKNEDDIVIRILNLYQIKPGLVLEVGCSNGFRLNQLNKMFRCNSFGVEPSELAIRDGKERFPKVNLIRGVCSNIPLDRKFDLIIVNFVFHWIDRENLQKCFEEVDRLLKTGGHLIVGDFFPDKPTKNKYHHLPKEGVITFKEDYAKLILESFGNYQHIAHLSTSHGDMKVLKSENNSNERVSVSLLLKN